jgi:plastocyanin
MLQMFLRHTLACGLAGCAAVTLGAAAPASIPMHAMHAPTSMKTAASAPAPGHAAAPEATLVKVVASAPAIVKIGNFTFGPEVLTVAPGTTVTWVNEDDIPHTVAASDKSFRSKVMDTDDRFSMTFAKPGTYEYFCSIHPHMTGKVVVKAP